jgi:hypothetical protein
MLSQGIPHAIAYFAVYGSGAMATAPIAPLRAPRVQRPPLEPIPLGAGQPGPLVPDRQSRPTPTRCLSSTTQTPSMDTRRNPFNQRNG